MMASGPVMNVARPASFGTYLSDDEIRDLTPAMVTSGIAATADLIRSSARQGEIDRRISDEVITAIGRTGYYYNLIPQEYGGTGATIDDYIEATLRAAQADLSTAWVASFYTLHNWLLAHFPAKAHDETWRGGFPYILSPAVGNPPGRARAVEGGFVVNGHWKWGTGVNHADWHIGFLLVEGRESEGLAMALMPIGDVTVIDTWHVSGMAATGSNDIVAKDVFVPDHRLVSLVPVINGNVATAERFGNPIFGLPMVPFLSLSAAVLPLGAARAVIALAKQRLMQHTMAGSSGAQAEKPVAQSRLARATLLAQSAELKIRYVMKRLNEFSGLGEQDKLASRIEMRAHLAEAAEMCREAISQVSVTAGSSLHMLDNPIQRMARDVAVISTHIVLDIDTALEQYGRNLLGLDPTSTYV